MEIKNYCLLENGKIESCFSYNHLRNIYKENGEWYLDHIEDLEDRSLIHHSKIVKFADKKEELK